MESGELTDAEILRWQEEVLELEASSGAIAGELGKTQEERQKNIDDFLDGNISLDDAA